MWEVTNGKQKKEFKTLTGVSDFMGYSISYCSQKARMGQKLDGWTIQKCIEIEKKRYNIAEISDDIEELKMLIIGLELKIDNMVKTWG